MVVELIKKWLKIEVSEGRREQRGKRSFTRSLNGTPSASATEFQAQAHSDGDATASESLCFDASEGLD